MKYSLQEALRELKGSKKIIEKAEDSEAEFPDSFEDIVDFLKADEEEAIKGYEKALDKVEDDFVKDQLDKINTEEKAHKAYLDKVVEDPAVEYTEPLEDEDDADESVAEENVEKNSIEEALKELRNSKKNTNEGIRDFEDKDAEEEYFRHIQELSTDYEDPHAEDYDEDDYEDYDEEDVEESLKEDTKFVTAATILKKEQNSIFAQPTEEGMRNMVLSILDKNKDKMKPENYNKVVKTMRSCPKKAVPSTVWTMLNPSQKVGK